MSATGYTMRSACGSKTEIPVDRAIARIDKSEVRQ
jgi:hypothetical protein